MYIIFYFKYYKIFNYYNSLKYKLKLNNKYKGNKYLL